MDNSTRRQLLDKARSAGFPGSILDVYSAYDQGRDLIGEFVQEQQAASFQPPMQVAQTPQEQEQGLRPAHEAGNVDQSMAFPNVQPGQSFNTVGMKVPINIDKVDNQGNLVESYKAVPPGIQNLPTGPYSGTVIETPARMQKGGVREKNEKIKYTTDPIKIQNYNDSLTVYNAFKNDKNILNSFNTFDEAIEFIDDRVKKQPETLNALRRLQSRPEGYESIGSSYTRELPAKGGKSAIVVQEFAKPKQPYKKYDPKDMLVSASKIEREPIQLVIPQSDRELNGYNNTLQVLRAKQKEDRSDKNLYPAKVVKAPEFKTGGVNKYQTAGEKEREDEAANSVYERMTRGIPTDAYDEFENAYDRKNPERAGEMSGIFDKNSGRNTWSHGNQVYDPGTYANWINKKLGREAVTPLQKPWTGPYDVTGRTSYEKLPDLIDTSEPYIDSGINYKTLTPSNPKNYSPRVADEDMIKTGGFKKQMGGSYQTNQEISMYEWRTGRPEESRKRYIKGGLKNRVLYNKAKYKR